MLCFSASFINQKAELAILRAVFYGNPHPWDDSAQEGVADPSRWSAAIAQDRYHRAGWSSDYADTSSCPAGWRPVKPRSLCCAEASRTSPSSLERLGGIGWTTGIAYGKSIEGKESCRPGSFPEIVPNRKASIEKTMRLAFFPGYPQPRPDLTW